MNSKKVGLSTLKKLRFQAMKVRDGEKCLRCGTTGGLSPSHVYPTGRYKNMEWIIDNVKPLCWACHIYWWHKNPIEASEWFKQRFPERYKRLKKISQQILPKPDLHKVKEEYELIISQNSKEPEDINQTETH